MLIWVALSTSPIQVVAGGSTVVSNAAINVSSSDREDYVVNVVEKPYYGWIVLDSWNLRERRVVYVSDRDATASRDSFSVAACISNHTCTQPQIVDVTLSQRNVQSPQLLRNEILRVSADKTFITNAHLDTEDPDTPASGVFFLISRPSNGVVVNANDLSKAIYNFSQKDVDDSSVLFMRHSNVRQKEWTRKDSFHFVLQKNGSDKPIEDEFRFRISTTYAALQDPTELYVKTSPLKTSKGGSVALTATHLEASGLASAASDENLILEVSTPPRHGVLEFLDGVASQLTWSDFQSETKLIYRHGGEESRDDSVTLFIYPASEKTRRSSRLRITLPIQITTLRDPLVQVIAPFRV
ncbi:unnamed protein product [Strongylus vulgaris]|uniref:Cadherin domain-containing protein n=1 Tax=Strongylus vulgaris TaxID=40348 RepID=A0A3P7JGU7_STRVU|nr:unnamed protein product [Strongylus vulgaris]